MRVLDRVSTLRTKIGLTAAGGLIVVMIMTGILVYTADTSEEIVSATRATQERMKGFTRLQERLDRFHRATVYTPPDDQVPQDLSPEEAARRMKNAEQTRLAFITALENIKTLPTTNPAEQPAREKKIIEKGYATLKLFSDRGTRAERVDEVWRESGQQAAVNEALRIYADFYALREMIQDEIVAEDKSLQHAMQRYENFRNAVIPAAVICLILAILGYGMLLALVWGRLSPGLKKLEHGAQAFGSGEMGHRIGLGGNDELSRLGRAFDDMAEQLALKQRSLQQFAERQEAAVEARTRELEAANAALAATDERRRAFFADISHELRTPLTIIRGEAQIALRSCDKAPLDAVPVLERILAQTRNLSRLVEDLFLIGRAEAGGLVLHREDLDLQRLIESSAENFSAIAVEVGASVKVESDAPVATFADPDRARASDERFDAFIVDIMLPDYSGRELCRRLRSANVRTPMLILSALDGTENKVEGLRDGADDYLTKPFDFDELLARIEALLRRSNASETERTSQLAFKDVVLDRSAFTVHKNGELIEFTAKEFQVLQLLMSSPGKVISRTRILNKVWGYDSDPLTNVVDVNIQRIRAKLQWSTGSGPLKTVRGYGYKLVADG